MRRRSRASSKLAKARSRKAMPKRGSAPAPRHSSSSTAGADIEFAQLRRERDEALLRETANSEILRLISTSPGDLELVFRTKLARVQQRIRAGLQWPNQCRRCLLRPDVRFPPRLCAYAEAPAITVCD